MAPAAIKLREIRKNRNSNERLIEKINSQRRSAVRRARAMLDRSAWSFLGLTKRKHIWEAVEALLRTTYDSAVRNGNDALSTSGEVQKAVAKAFEEHARLFVLLGEDDPLPFELFDCS
ncbi:hypothetical protein TruAng_007407 [Truncatella angustata]|nr:hypothetical protein TruAng_007407 [Truncatella angustata]